MEAADHNINNLPPEIVNVVFDNIDDIDLARFRSVCCYWRNIIQSGYNTYLEMTDLNWEAYVKNSTASRICLKLKLLYFPVYIAPEFKNFISRVRILQLEGCIPVHNVVNILKECHILTLIAIDRATVPNFQLLQQHTSNQNDATINVQKLFIGIPTEDSAGEEFLSLVDFIGCLGQKDSLKELVVSHFFRLTDVLRLLFAEVFKEEPKPTGYRNNVIGLILSKQIRSLQRITFSDEFGILPSTATSYIKFHRCTTGSDVTHHAQILESCFTSSDILEPRHHQVLHMILQIYEKQCTMTNLVIYYFNQLDIDQIKRIIRNNAETLYSISVSSLEPMQLSYRTFSCTTFATCSKLEKLTLSANFENRKVKLLDFFQLPISLKTLSLTGFIPTGPTDWLNVAGTPDHPNLTQMSLSYLPWLLQNETPVVVFDKSMFDWLRKSFSKIRKLKLKAFSPSEIVTLEIANAIGLENVSSAISAEFLQWCNRSGRTNGINEVESITILNIPSPQHLPVTEDIYTIVLRNNPT